MNYNRRGLREVKAPGLLPRAALKTSLHAHKLWLS